MGKASLAVIGNVNVDLIMGPVEPWPTSGTEIIVDHDELRVGGAAGNSALAWDGLGVDYQIAASIGSDQFGQWLADAFGPRAARWPVAKTGTTLSVGITHPNGERTFFTTRGHLPSLTWRETRDQLDAEALAGGMLLLCGCFLMDALAADYDALFDWADSVGIRVALDTGWPLAGWTPEACGNARGWLSRSHCVLLNEIEATALSGTTSPHEAAQALRASMPAGAIAVVKRGPDGAIAVGEDGVLISALVPKIDVIDTIGAGDVFNAAFLAGIALGRSLEESLEAGVTVASQAISTHPRRYDASPFFSAAKESL